MVFSFRHRWVFTLGESRVELFSPRRAIGPNKKGREAFDPPAVLKFFGQIFSTPQADRRNKNNSRNKNSVCLLRFA
jgi:hypothetical protein